MYRKRYLKEATFEVLRIIEPVGQRYKLSMSEVAFRWLTNHSALNVKDGGKDGIIIGVSSQEQLEQNLRELGKGPLPDDVLKALDEAWMISKSTAADYWHGDLGYSYDTKEAFFGVTSFGIYCMIRNRKRKPTECQDACADWGDKCGTGQMC